MVGKNPQEVLDRALYLLQELGLTDATIRRCTGAGATALYQARKRVDAGRYGRFTQMTLQEIGDLSHVDL